MRRQVELLNIIRGVVLPPQADLPKGSGVDECDRQVALGLSVHGLASFA